jgi:UDP-N-acetylmuramoylalanine--D-glutamate ligase
VEDFKGRDFILKAAGVPYDSEYIACAKEHDIPVYMSAALVSSIVMNVLEGVTIIGVTGTRGKTTTTEMIAHVLSSLGCRVHKGGNIRGVANLPLLYDIEDGDFLVLELDSWQLQGFGDLKISPHIAVFTNFLDDHMNYYKNDKERYFSDKANVYRNQKEYDVLIAGAQAAHEICARDKGVKVSLPEMRHYTLKLIGEHNQAAASLAYEVASQCGFEDGEIQEALATFTGVEGRLEDLGLFGNKNVRVFNDNNATTGDATIAGLKAVVETCGKKPIVILGGADKGLSLENLENELNDKAKACVFLSGTGTERLSLPKKYYFETLRECVEEAFHLAEEGDVILFSPTFASFSNEFHNEYERNDAFVACVQEYKII